MSEKPLKFEPNCNKLSERYFMGEINMNKLTKKILALAGTFLLAFSSFALGVENVISCDEAGTGSPQEFDSLLGDTDWVTELFLSEMEAGNVDKFFSINSDNADEEDYEMLDVVEECITGSFEEEIEDGGVFITTLYRSIKADKLDGWIVGTQYREDDGWIHYVYYYSVSF